MCGWAVAAVSTVAGRAGVIEIDDWFKSDSGGGGIKHRRDARDAAATAVAVRRGRRRAASCRPAHGHHQR